MIILVIQLYYTSFAQTFTPDVDSSDAFAGNKDSENTIIKENEKLDLVDISSFSLSQIMKTRILNFSDALEYWNQMKEEAGINLRLSSNIAENDEGEIDNRNYGSDNEA